MTALLENFNLFMQEIVIFAYYLHNESFMTQEGTNVFLYTL